MGSNHLSEWGATLDGLIYTLCLQGKRNDMAVTLRRDSRLSHAHRSDTRHGGEMKWGGTAGEYLPTSRPL